MKKKKKKIKKRYSKKKFKRNTKKKFFKKKKRNIRRKQKNRPKRKKINYSKKKPKLKSNQATRKLVLSFIRINQKLKSTLSFNFNLDKSLQNFFMSISR